MQIEYLNRLMAEVEARTGYSVIVVNDDKLQSNVVMKTASSELPNHIIMLNPEYERGANYLVAAQCLMLLMKQASEKEVCEFAVLDEKFEYLVGKALGQMTKINIPSDIRRPYAEQIVKGLLQQLNSMPCEIMGIRKIHRDAPELRTEMEYVLNSVLAVNLEALSPEIRASSPKDIFTKNATMNAAFAIICGDVLGNQGLVQPYKNIGLLDEGNKLADIIRNLSGPEETLYRKAVDSWAEHLKMRTMYKWTLREK